MEGGVQTSPEKVCDICGHAGFDASIATCSLCKVSSEHTYCMRFVRYEVPEEWHCEECLFGAESVRDRHAPVNQEVTITALGSTSAEQEVHQFSHKRTSRKIVAGKVRFITNEEVVTLASGKRSHGRGNPCVSGHHGDYADVKPPHISWKTVKPPLSSSNVLKTPFRPKKRPAYAGVDVPPSKHNTAPIRPMKEPVYAGVDVPPKHTTAPIRPMKEPVYAGVGVPPKHTTAPIRPMKEPVYAGVDVPPKHTTAPFRPMKGPIYAGVVIPTSKHTMATKHVDKERGTETAGQVCKTEPAEGKASASAYNFSTPCTRPNEVRCDVADSLHADAGRIRMADKHLATLKPQDDCLFIKEPANASLAIEEVRDLHKKIDANVLPFNESGIAVRSIPQFSETSSQEMFLPLKLVISSDEKHNHALEACWRGTFEVLDLVTQFHGTVNAHLSCQVSPKVYDISKQFPGTLQFKVLPRENVWPKIFKLSPPTKDDVALYFRCEVNRHKEKYAHFVQHIDLHDYALQGCVADVELLLFTSAQLQIDSQQFGGCIYLWGVFRHVKYKKAEEKAASVRASAPKVHHLTQDRSKIPLDVSSMEVDMEVDMVGGCPIGRIDQPIKLEDTTSGFVKPIQRSPVCSIKLEDTTSGFVKPIQRSPVCSIQRKSTTSSGLDTPPGFPITAYKRPDPAKKYGF